MADTRIYRTAGTPTSTKKFTLSFWCKKAGKEADQFVFNTTTDANNRCQVQFSDADQLDFICKVSGSNVARLKTTRKFRDTSAFYHIVAVLDTTQSTNTDRIKLYINGEQNLSANNGFASEIYPSQDSDVNVSGTHTVGSYYNGSSASNYFNGLLTHVHFTDGYAYQASDFGQTDSTSGIWKPKVAPSVTYGTNGFFLKFENSANLDLDSSGNNLSFTTAGTLTQNIDTPSNNFPTISTNMNSYNTPDILYGNLRVGGSSSNDYSACADKGVITGKWYWEVKIVNANNTRNIGIVRADKAMISTSFGFYIASTGNSTTTAFTCGLNGGNGQVYNKAGGSQAATDISATLTTNDIVGIALDLSSATKTIQFYKNGSAAGSAITLDNAFVDDFILPGSRTDTDQDVDYNFGSGYFGVTAVSSANADGNGIGAFEYAVPSGYYAICTKNIKEFG